MDPNGTLIVSDAHLGAAPADHEAAFLRFLESVVDRTRDLVINGDLFDFWFEYGTVIQRRHFPVLKILRSLVESGVRVRLVAGNHDFWGGSFLTDQIGLELVEGPVRTEIGGRPALLAHGDGLGSGDLGYKALKRVIRGRPARSAFRWLHPDLAAGIIRLVSRTESRHGRTPDAESLGRAGRLHEWAADRLAEDPDLQVVALAHCHVPEIREILPGRFYVNSGDWVQHCSWAEFSPDGVRVLGLAGSGSDDATEVLYEVVYPSGPDRNAVLEGGSG
ncbi:MAG: UDP-2,3-diacylglucosamine diphosphatase [marine benthic group bacterium]|jgi:UDP-2,3-diacylglucosamine hydrolase|nr:UDP-2,3-diacylglucosamine diphosphatase [Gemmatimonadota bacterium]MCL7963096.1 UDP-2,3-diacylglucosamine diphosphatase [Candidatus Carthagonibacter metallireducens]MCL7936855.1 UDP-2,3-diacylglucosamine diphosphatase [Gemmatimonadota bacterium]MCL7958340.1 UDP-2,3-diacylglucosamine diphosphatase [Gemmatimonadota bacterium]MCL7964875.1 UDP-2,3-diacylglucosamine diphosphatase [Gemmatimonadota bacterium]